LKAGLTKEDGVFLFSPNPSVQQYKKRYIVKVSGGLLVRCSD